MPERRLSYQEFDDDVEILILFEAREIVDDFYWDVEDMPNEAKPGDQYQPEFEDGELVAFHYDEELTAQKRKDFKDAVKRYKEMLEDN